VAAKDKQVSNAMAFWLFKKDNTKCVQRRRQPGHVDPLRLQRFRPAAVAATR
jgi:hypothetical protein